MRFWHTLPLTYKQTANLNTEKIGEREKKANNISDESNCAKERTNEKSKSHEMCAQNYGRDCCHHHRSVRWHSFEDFRSYAIMRSHKIYMLAVVRTLECCVIASSVIVRLGSNLEAGNREKKTRHKMELLQWLSCKYYVKAENWSAGKCCSFERPIFVRSLNRFQIDLDFHSSVHKNKGATKKKPEKQLLRTVQMIINGFQIKRRNKC